MLLVELQTFFEKLSLRQGLAQLKSKLLGIARKSIKKIFPSSVAEYI